MEDKPINLLVYIPLILYILLNHYLGYKRWHTLVVLNCDILACKRGENLSKIGPLYNRIIIDPKFIDFYTIFIFFSLY